MGLTKKYKTLFHKHHILTYANASYGQKNTTFFIYTSSGKLLLRLTMNTHSLKHFMVDVKHL